MSEIMSDARKISLMKRRKKREERILKVLGYLKLNPNQTVYDLQKYFDWPIGSIHSILKELEEDLHLKSRTIVENNRQKKLYRLMLEEDYIVDHFNEETLLVPFNLRAAKNAIKNGYEISIEMKNGSIVKLSPGDNIDYFIKNNNIKLELED